MILAMSLYVSSDRGEIIHSRSHTLGLNIVRDICVHSVHWSPV